MLTTWVVDHAQEAEGHAKEAEDSDELRVLLSQIYSNRAFAHLMIKNYRSCKEDCDKALKLTPGNVKAWYRKAKVRYAAATFRVRWSWSSEATHYPNARVPSLTTLLKTGMSGAAAIRGRHRDVRPGSGN